MDTTNQNPKTPVRWNKRSGSRSVPLPNQRLEPVTDEEKESYSNYIDDLIDSAHQDLREDK